MTIAGHTDDELHQMAADAEAIDAPADYDVDDQGDGDHSAAVERILDGLVLPDTPPAAAGRLHESPSTLDKLRAATITTAALKAMPPADPLIDGLLDLNTLAMLYGPSGASKSFLAVDWALHIVTGSWWLRRQVHTGPVVYVAAEGAGGLGRRVDAWQQHHGIYDLDRHHPVHWVTIPVHLFHLDWAAAFTELCTGLAPVLVIVDTLARSALGADENSSKDAGAIIDNLDRVRRATGACVMPVHHTGKDTGAGARGSSALRAAMDTELELTATDERHVLKITKQKDGPAPHPIRLVRQPVAESCVLVPDVGQTGNTTGQLPASVQTAYDTLRSIEVPGGIPTSVWEQSTETGRRSFYNARSELVNLGLVINIGTERSPRYLTHTRLEDQP